MPLDPPPPLDERVPAWKYLRALAPAILFWAVLVGWLAYLLYSRTHWSAESDQANLREWLDESRIFRKTLPELVREYVTLLDDLKAGNGGPEALRARAAESPSVGDKAAEIREQLRALADPIRQYQGQLPLFPEIYRLEVSFPDYPHIDPLFWDSPLPRPRRQNQARVFDLEYLPLGRHDRRALFRCEYRLHAFNKLQRDEAQRQYVAWGVAGVVLAGGVLAVAWVLLFLRRERERELRQLAAASAVEHARRLLLEEQLRAREAEREKEELDRKLLEQSLEAARQESRAAEAERATLELRSQLYASIGIMAGSYAHNIKNLLVRPNDLLARCLEADGLSGDQETMLREVRTTLGTVTERLQQILRTVRRDPSRAEMTRLDLNAIVADTQQTWAEMGREKWKLAVRAEIAPGPLPVQGDLSHLQQAIENLLFNARDATFEMRNHLRDAARKVPASDPAARKQALIEAAAWKGQVTLRTYRRGDRAVLEVRDNGIGMTEEVLRQCVQTHFTTKRDNALYEGYNAGMGLGLSFVVVVLEHHGAELEIESEPFKGATFRALFPLAAGEVASASNVECGVRNAE